MVLVRLVLVGDEPNIQLPLQLIEIVPLRVLVRSVGDHPTGLLNVPVTDTLYACQYKPPM